MRKDYNTRPFKTEEAAEDPLRQFDTWFNAALTAGQDEPNAMTLATVDSNGWPNARMVLLKGYDGARFRFFTNYKSQKAAELEDGKAALVFWWPTCHRQVRVRGRVERLPAKESDEYFNSRPRGSKIAAICSKQGQPLKDRESFERKVEELDRSQDDVERPDYWGGFAVIPEQYEFWQGQSSRLHYRLTYHQDSEGAWSQEILYP
ncbi:uncharacterized protein MONBRDRAFT_13418 [Monosiga brevicollis MX1]|uniref:pyridoxal 5'-phosphate synthase n=1 Tax=Monosiga brevicollis TaxID=81824 RepID=A9UPS4_MONBE|nr:uncharacterized protein MONBRDRAFT_13418 [Monosiga brevicollis MX1]EDQ92921.1 predicted protein [Monosiga brevicollis MX1]|eukprot:XP_001742683.1 hypothetical protein [Monosiga brevicollis MX1]